MTSEMELVVDAGGCVRCIYGEELDLREIGRLTITRASHVEPDTEGYWWAELAHEFLLDLLPGAGRGRQAPLGGLSGPQEAGRRSG